MKITIEVPERPWQSVTLLEEVAERLLSSDPLLNEQAKAELRQVFERMLALYG